jgi:hypothetical protein
LHMLLSIGRTISDLNNLVVLLLLSCVLFLSLFFFYSHCNPLDLLFKFQWRPVMLSIGASLEV